MGKIISIFGPYLADARAKAGLTQEELAKELGVGRVTLTGWENQVRIKVDDNLQKLIKKVLNVDANVLTYVPHGTSPETEVYKNLAAERMERINDLKEQVQRLKDELDECKSGRKKK